MTAADLLIGVLVLGLVIWQQLIPRRVRSNMRIALVLAIIGLAVTFAVQRIVVIARSQHMAIPGQNEATGLA